MKKFFYVPIFFLFFCFFISGCSGDKKAVGDGAKVDLDISAMNSMLAYAQVVNMYERPGDYMGKTIKLNGVYYESYYDETDLYYHYVVVGDEALCCRQGLEFLRKGEYVYPDDYPSFETAIELVGVFKDYEELGITYYFLDVDEMRILN